MIKRFFILLLAIVASVGMMNAKVTWNRCNISDLNYVYGTDGSYSKEGVTLSTHGDEINAMWFDYGDESQSGINFNANQTGGFTFSNTLGKNFTKIEMTLRGPGGWDMANLGSGWLFNWNHGEESVTFTVTWTGNASTVDLLKEVSDFHGDYVKRIVFYFVGDSEEPDPTYTVALKDGTANADKVTLSATSVEECTTVTVTPNEECDITAFKATYNTTEELSTSFNTETGAYSFTMPAANVTIEATIALKPVPEGDVFAGFTATAGSGGFNNEGHANLVDNKFTSADWTKWCADNSYKSVPTGESGDACWWIDFEASAALNLTGYILTTGNDTGNEHGRNPKNWLLKAKLNADDAWTTIATVTNDVTMKNQSFKDYKFFVDQSGSYKYFRFEVFANQGAGVMQLCQLRLIGTDTPAPANSCGGGLTWELNNGELVISYDGEGTGVMNDYDIPNDNPAPWYANRENITSVSLPEGIKTIGKDAFRDCVNLTTVTIPNSVTTIGESAFVTVEHLETVTIGTGITSIVNGAFYGCEELTTVTCSATTPPSIGGMVFGSCPNLEHIYVPAESVDAYKTAWSDYASLISSAAPANQLYMEVDGTAGTLKWGLAGSNPVYDGDVIQYDNRKDITTLTIDESCQNHTLTSFYNLFYSFSGLTTINGLDNLATANVESMRYMFYNCKALTSLDLSSFNTANVTDMKGMFNTCSNLTTIYVGDGWNTSAVTDGNAMFYGCTNLPNYDSGATGVDKAYVGAGGYLSAMLTPADVMALINAIGTVELTAECKAKIDAARAAYDALSDGDKDLVTNITTLTTAEAAFENVMNIWLSGDCDAILWKDTTLTVKKHAGEGNGAMADYTSYYGDNTAPWYNSHWYNPQPGDIVIKSVTLEEGVTHIGENAFGWMSELKTITIPSSMTSIGEDAFYWSKAVDDIYLTADPSNLTWVLPYSADNQFKPEKATRCHVPADLLTAYQETFGTLNMTFVGDLDPITPLTPEQQQALDAAKGLINAIPSPVVYTPACKDAIDAARTAYDALTPDMLKQLVSNYATLTAAEATYESLKDVAVAEAKIAAIPQPVTLKLATRDSIESARAAYDALTADQKLLVGNYAILEAAEAAWAGLINVAPAGALSGKYTINDGGDVIYFAHGNLQYTRENLDADWSTGTFRLATNQYDLIELVKTYPEAYCTDNYGDKTAVGLFGWGTWGEGKTPNLTSSDRTLYTWSTDFSGTLEGTDTWRTLTKDEWVYLLAHNNQSYATVHGVNGLLVAPDGKDIEGKSMADWVEINDETWTTMQNDGYLFLPACGQRSQLSGANITTGGQGEEVLYYSSTEYNDTYAYNIWYTPGSQTIDDHSNKRQAFGIRLVSAGVNPLDQVQVVKGLIDDIPAEITLDAACVNAIQAARTAYDALDNDAKDILAAADVDKLTDAEQALKDLNQAEADEVIAKINNIPTPVELTLATRDSIESARAAYDALTTAQQDLVTNYQKLTDAEAALAALNPGVPPATPLDSAQAVKDLIDVIPTPVEYPTSGPAIAAALVAYNQLSDAAQDALDSADVQKMTDAATQYAALDAIAAIEAIPAEITYDPAVKAAIESAREKYDALIDASKELVGTEVLNKLTNAEEAWADLVALIEHNVSYIGKDGELKHETVALLHIPDPAPDFNGYEFVRWDVKAGDFLEEGLRIKAVYTPIITTNPQGFDTLAYNGLAQELVKAGVANEGHIEYSLYPEEPESWSAELPKATIAGVYAIYYKLVREGHADYIAPEPTMATIAKVPVTYVAPTAVDTLVYNASNQTLIAAGQTNDGTFEYSLDPTLPDGWSAELPQAMAAGTYSVYYRVQGDLNHLDSTAVDPIAVTIAKAALTATADDKNVIYGDAVPEYSVTYAGWQGDDDASVLTGDIAFACEYLPTSNVGEYTITPSGVDAANYTITFVNGKVTVAQALLTVTAENKNVVYGDSVPEYTAAYEGWKNTDDASVVSGLVYTCEYAPTSNVGEYTIVPSDATALNYTFAYVNGTLTVNKAALMITAENKNVVYGDSVPEYTAAYEGWKNSDDASVVSGLVYTCEYAPTSNVGEYTITPSGATATNYNISYTNGKVTVAKAALMITADDKNVIYGDAAPTYTATYSGWKNTDDASVVSGLVYTCEYAPTSNVGEYTITPSDATATNYAISYTNGKVTVAQATLTVTAENKSVEYGEVAPAFTATYNGWKNNDDASVVSNLAYICDYAVTSNVGTYDIMPDSATALNYTFAYVKGTLTVNQAALMITAEDKNVIYGDTVPEYTASYSGWKNSDDASVVSGLVYTCEYAPTSNVGEYTITPSGATATNYNISYTNGTVTVDKAALMITADDKNVIYGDAAPTYTATYSGWKNTDDASVVSGLAYTCEYAPTSNVGEYAIIPSGATATNYAISYTNGKVTVAQATLTITANDTVMIYGDAAPAFTASYSGWLNGDDESLVSGLAFSTPYQPGSPIGTYAINPNSATAQNYQITFVDGKLTVNKAVVSVSGATVHEAKFADGHAGAEVTNGGQLNGVKLNDAVSHVTTASFSSAEVSEHLTITLFYELTGDAALLNNYDLQPTSEIFTTEGVIIEPFHPDTAHTPEEGEQVEVEEGIDVYAYGYCDGSGYSLKYHLNSGNPNQYKIDFDDSRFDDIDWTNLTNAGKDGTIEIEIPVDMPTGDYTMTVYFRDSRFTWLESQALNVTFHVNLPETYVQPLFNNVIALVDTCHCLTDIQWYYRANSSEPWKAIPGATGHYYRPENGAKLEGEYFVSAKMDGVPTYTCGQSDMETLYGEPEKPKAQVHAYPNPVVNTTNVTIEGSTEWNHSLRIVNMMGIEVENTTFEGNETSVEMSTYPQGNYMISVDGIVVKVMKQ